MNQKLEKIKKKLYFSKLITFHEIEKKNKNIKKITNLYLN